MAVAKHLDKVGVAGSILAALCCLGVPALVSLLAALGLGFLLQEPVRAPLLLSFLLLTLWGLFAGFRRHRHATPFVLGLVAAAALATFSLLHMAPILAGISVGGLVTASVLNVILGRPHRCSITRPAT